MFVSEGRGLRRLQYNAHCRELFAQLLKRDGRHDLFEYVKDVRAASRGRERVGLLQETNLTPHQPALLIEQCEPARVATRKRRRREGWWRLRGYLSNGQTLGLSHAQATILRDAHFRAGRARRDCRFARGCGCAAGWRSGAGGDRFRWSSRAQGARRAGAANLCRCSVGRQRVGNAGAAARVEWGRLSGRRVAGQVMTRFVRPVDEARAGRRLTLVPSPASLSGMCVSSVSSTSSSLPSFVA